jgi:cation diffusion facilitator family transporter
MSPLIDPVQRTRDSADGLRVTWIGLVINLLLVGLKFWGGVVGRSQALIADAVHSLSDLFSDVVVLLGLRWGRKEADEDHPYGHGRIETIATVFVGLTLLGAGIGIAYNAIDSIYAHRTSQPTTIALVMAVISIFSKEWMYWFTVKVGRRIHSPALIGNAWHHRSDAFSSVAVFIGLVATQINPAWHLADAVAALLVSALIFRIGGKLCYRAFRELADTAPEEKILAELQHRAEAVAGVLQVHDLKARHSGPQLLVEMHVVVDGAMTVFDGHEIAREVRLRLMEDMNVVSEVFVHLDPDTELH